MKAAFVINCYFESASLRECLGCLRASYPDAPVAIVDDSPRLRPHPTGGRWIERWLMAGLKNEADYIVKIDPDTRVLRPLSTLPDTDLFGFRGVRIDRRDGVNKQYIWGGFLAIRREAAQKIIDSGLLRDGRFEDSFYDQDSYPEFSTGHHLSLADWIMDDVRRELGLTIANHPQIHFRWREDVPGSEWSSYAVVGVEKTVRSATA